MMAKSSSRSDLWRLLNLAEDYFRDGFRQPHPELPAQAAVVVEATAAAATVVPEAAAAPVAASGAQAAPTAAPAATPLTAASDPAARLAALAREVADCTRCALHRGRRHTVPGEGAPVPAVLVVGEGPGAEEDASGRPFVGKAGQYLDKWLAAVQLDRVTNCFIANAVKCRPPGNRDPLPVESAACLPYLRAQIAVLRPRAILAVGRIAGQLLTGLDAGVGELRRKQHMYEGVPLAVTYHPSAVLRDSLLRAPVWEDLKRLKSLLDPGDHA